MTDDYPDSGVFRVVDDVHVDDMDGGLRLRLSTCEVLQSLMSGVGGGGGPWLSMTSD